MGCLLTGVELFPGNVLGGLHRASGRLGQRPLDRSGDQELPAEPARHAHPVRLARIRRHGARPCRHLDAHGLCRCEQADRADRRSLSDVRQALRPDEGSRKPARACSTTCGRICAGRPRGQRRGPPAARRACTFVREMEQELQRANREPSAMPCPNWSRLKTKTTTCRALSKMQIDLMVNSFVADFTRVATLQYTNSVGNATMPWLDIDERHHDLSHKAGQRPPGPGTAHEDQRLVLRAARVSGASPGRHAGAGRRRAACSTTPDRVDERVGQGQRHTLDNIPFVLVGGGLDFRMGRSLSTRRLTTACCCRWRTAWAIGSTVSATPTTAATAR